MGTAFGCNLLSDVLSYFKYQNSPVYLCSLDAEKCFDNICHKSLFFKLIDVIPSNHWILCYRWYARLCATVKWQGSYSSMFLVTKGTRQGSILSPYFFNIFINDLLLSLKNMNEGVAIGNLKLNSFAYADDVNLFCSSASGLQSLIDVCHNYSITWRFKFGIRKTKCMIYGNNLHPSPPKWRLGSDVIAIDNKLDILGTTFTKDGQCTEHVENRIRKCRQSFYSLSNSGMAFPGATVDVKRYLWNSICTPVLTYGLDGININITNMKKLETTQGNLIKQCLGISKRCHSTELLLSMNVHKISDLVKRNTVSIFNRIMKVSSPAKDLNLHFLSLYMCKGTIVPGTLVSRLLSIGVSPVAYIFNSSTYNLPTFNTLNGHVDSIRNLLYHENVIKPYSDEHTLVYLLTKYF